ncbi:VOC family protein [Pyxidicoccus sp. 3LG]
MPIKSATPYLFPNGRTEQAIALYQRAFGATTQTLQRFGDVDGSCPAAMKNRVMHAELLVGKALLMLSDGPGEMSLPMGGNVSVALDFEDEAQLRKSFDVLATSGKVLEPIINAPWGGFFGVVQDEFGIQWMATAPSSKK